MPYYDADPLQVAKGRPQLIRGSIETCRYACWIYTAYRSMVSWRALHFASPFQYHLLSFDRTRRIKCDEHKPSCLRCNRDRYSCEWFITPHRAPKGEASKGRTLPLLLPKEYEKASLVTPASSARVSLLPLARWKATVLPADPSAQPTSNLFETDLEKRYFHVFCDKIVPQLAGFAGSPLWSRLVLQGSESNTAVRHAIIAIGALDTTVQVSTTRNHLGSECTSDEHHRLAIRQYSKAITQMRISISEGKHDLRTTLLTCLLIICFECLHGNQESAIAQMRSGIELLEHWLARKESISSDREKSAEYPGGLTASAFGIRSPMPNVIEDE
jgi:hypothetical protein